MKNVSNLESRRRIVSESVLFLSVEIEGENSVRYRYGTRAVWRKIFKSNGDFWLLKELIKWLVLLEKEKKVNNISPQMGIKYSDLTMPELKKAITSMVE
ncbi:hypothetical protein NPIL_589771 [Nephila pilipes]|uniref:Uncharacterized protein n=1 Tax=Nephila pilipes TaxID=299642 RepID=A0A8X6MAV1_NEPPI|nr:hypothetical protein NPIL_589771 [Nephila pilipes]